MNREQAVARSTGQLLDAVEVVIRMLNGPGWAGADCSLRMALDNFKIICGDPRAPQPRGLVRGPIPLDAKRETIKLVGGPGDGKMLEIQGNPLLNYPVFTKEGITSVIYRRSPTNPQEYLYDAPPGMAWWDPEKSLPAKEAPVATDKMALGIGVLRLSRAKYQELFHAAMRQGTSSRDACERLLTVLGYPGGRIVASTPHTSSVTDDFWVKIEHASIPVAPPGGTLPEIPLGGLTTVGGKPMVKIEGKSPLTAVAKHICDLVDNDPDFQGISLSDYIKKQDFIANKEVKSQRCECGATTIRSSTHSSWCPLAEGNP